MTRAVIICGSRDWPVVKIHIIENRITEIPRHILIVEGGSRGVDRMVAQICREQQRPFMEIPAEWHRYGRVAGTMRSQRMLTMKPDMVIAFTTGVPIAPETRHTIKLALAEYLPVQLFTLTEGPFVLRDPIELQMWEHDHSPDRESSPVP